MWIRSQDKRILQEFIGVQARGGNETKPRIYGVYGNSESEILGYYPTHERCLEVLDEIQNTIIRYEVPLVYEMPKE
ncbi:MAG: hypothetical protein EOM44_15335 [Bacteroidia bacterium]|nr:hypothetical protein [Bacteroidia bacterium]